MDDRRLRIIKVRVNGKEERRLKRGAIVARRPVSTLLREGGLRIVDVLIESIGSAENVHLSPRPQA